MAKEELQQLHRGRAGSGQRKVKQETEAERKKRLFEERLAREQDERQVKKHRALLVQKQQEEVV